MTNTVVDLNGKPLKQGKYGRRNPIVAQMLKRATARNTRGEVAAMVLVTVSPQGTPTQMFHWGADDGSFTYMLGAWEIAKQSLVGRVLDCAETEDVVVEDD